MRSVPRLGVLAAMLLLGVGTAHAQGWRTYGALSGGVALDHFSDWSATGATLQAYIGLETPTGLSLGVVAEGTEAWGELIQQPGSEALRRVELDYRLVGLELRMRFLRDSVVSPWVGARIAISRSTPLTPSEAGELVRQQFENTSSALRVGLDWWLGTHWGLSGSTSMQWCDVRAGGEELGFQVGVQCTRPIQTILLGPTVRF